MSLLFAEDVYGLQAEQQVNGRKPQIKTMQFNGNNQELDGIKDYVTKNNMILAGVLLVGGFAIWWNFFREKKGRVL